jgi:DNA end-binding protein Ku
MAARAISSATISFGLVSIPVKVYTAISPKTVHFNTLDARHLQRVKQQFVSSRTGEVVERGETVKGYEYAKGQFVVLSDDELKALESRSDQTIGIAEFAPIEQVDPIYFEKVNYLGPDKGGHKAYALLARTMRDTGRVAIGRYNARGRQPLVLLRPFDSGLAMHGLYYADEVRSFQEQVELESDVVLGEKELELARQLVDSLASEHFDPARYEDDYRKGVLAAIERKVAGQEIVAAEPAEAREQIIDLVAALKKSLAAREGEAAAARPARKAAKSKRPAPGKRSASGS